MAYPNQQVGFVMPNQGPGPGAYQQPYYPPQNVHQQQPPYNHQPFPGPIQLQQPGYAGSHTQAPDMNSWYSNRNFADYLYSAGSFHVKQQVDLLETLVGWEQENKYTVKDPRGNKIFYVGESSDWCTRQCWPRGRPFNMTVKDAQGANLLTFDRPLECSCCCGAICPDSLKVSTANGILLGSVKENFNIFHPQYSLKNNLGKTVLRIEGPWCPLSYKCQQVVFKVTTRDGMTVGTISKEWGGLVRELFTDADYFSISFPHDLDPSMKAVCLGALFLIDFQFFESNRKGKQGGRKFFFG